MSATRENSLGPTLSLLLGASLWGVIWYPMRLLEQRGLSGLWLTFVLYETAFVAFLAWLAIGPGSALVRLGEFTRRPAAIGLLMLVAGWTNVAFIEAVLTGNILRVLLLFYLAPLWQVIMGWLFLRERPSRAGLASLAVAMCGALTMLWDERLGFPWPTGSADWYALSSGFAFAASNVIVRSLREISVETKALSVWLGVVAVATLLIVFGRVALPAASAGAWAGAMVLGFFGILFMTLLVQFGVTYMPVHRSAVLALIELVAGAVSQQLLTDELVTYREWIGGGLIVAGAWMAARSEGSRQDGSG